MHLNIELSTVLLIDFTIILIIFLQTVHLGRYCDMIF